MARLSEFPYKHRDLQDAGGQRKKGHYRQGSVRSCRCYITNTDGTSQIEVGRSEGCIIWMSGMSSRCERRTCSGEDSPQKARCFSWLGWSSDACIFLVI